MSRGIIRKPSFNKIIGAYRSQWKRFWMQLFTFGTYGKKGMGWLKNPKKAWYNFWYHKTSVSVYQILGYKPSRLSCFFAMLCASVVSIVISPIDATRAGVTAHQMKKAYQAKTEKTSSSIGTSNNTTRKNKLKTTSSCSSTGSSNTVKRTRVTTKTAPQRTTTSVTVTPVVIEDTKKESVSLSIPKIDSISIQPEESKVLDENTPKSKPKNERDQYIRKRMVIAGSSYCDRAVLEKLQIGTYFDLEAEPDNPHDKDAIKLTLSGEKIGYIARSDQFLFGVSLKLKRKIYGVITDIISEPSHTKYEFETWVDQAK